MNKQLTVGLLAAALLMTSAVDAADNKTIVAMATCQDSWLDWVPGSGQSEKFVRDMKQSFTQKPDADAYTPLRPTTYLGRQITAVQPESVGMALGFSLAVEASFGDMKKAIENHMKKTFEKCNPSGDGNSCEMEIAEKKTIFLMGSADKTQRGVLTGCYYYYEK